VVVLRVKLPGAPGCITQWRPRIAVGPVRRRAASALSVGEVENRGDCTTRLRRREATTEDSYCTRLPDPLPIILIAAIIDRELTKELTVSAEIARQKYPFTLLDLPYAYDALEPHIDQKTMQLHHDGHHATYVKKLNEALAGVPALQSLTLAELLREPDRLPDAVRTAVINNGGGHLLHDLFWNSLTPRARPSAQGPLADAVNLSFGALETFRQKFSDAATKHFASGWVALVFDHTSTRLSIENLKDHTVPRVGERTALLILDVWEHAYYLKFQNRRPEFIEAFWKVVNWEHAEQLFERASAAPTLRSTAAL
jgi:Fe-Mn family superoxide dismutase